MAGQITHYWDGTKLVVTSDSGTSACDLKGEKGDLGARGCQGEPGIGLDGSKIVSTVFIETDANGGNVYEQTFSDGATARFTAPKGYDGCEIVSTEFIGKDEEGGNIYEQTFSNGHTAQFTAPIGYADTTTLAYKVKVEFNGEMYSTVITLPTETPMWFEHQITCMVYQEDWNGEGRQPFYLLRAYQTHGKMSHWYNGESYDVNVDYELLPFTRAGDYTTYGLRKGVRNV